MSKKAEYLFAEVIFDPVMMERFSNEQSVHHQSEEDKYYSALYKKYEHKLKWHIRNSLSERQKEVIQLISAGKTEREIAEILGISHQVVHIYKIRAIRKLQTKIKA